MSRKLTTTETEVLEAIRNLNERRPNHKSHGVSCIVSTSGKSQGAVRKALADLESDRIVKSSRGWKGATHYSLVTTEDLAKMDARAAQQKNCLEASNWLDNVGIQHELKSYAGTATVDIHGLRKLVAAALALGLPAEDLRSFFPANEDE